MEGYKSPSFMDYYGLNISAAFSPNAILSSINYQHKPGQLFFASYPKCGSTWGQRIVMLILRKGRPIDDEFEYFCQTPSLDVAGPEVLNFMNGPGIIKTHFPFSYVLTSPEAKYIYIARNPMDCCVSSYYQTKELFFYNFQNGTFDEYFELFINGKTNYCDYFDHLLSWYEHKDDPNVHFLTYENLKRDTRGEVLKIARFIGEDYYEALRTDPNYLKNVLYHCSFEQMKKEYNVAIDSFLAKPSGVSEIEEATPGLKYFYEFKCKYAPKNNTNGIHFVRKGIVGDWKNHFSPEQELRMKQWIKKKTEGSDVMDLWKDIIP